MKGVAISIWNVRFDFGIPLEDMFPTDDIHPRLKFLLEKGVQSAVDSGLTINEILSIKQESLEKRLALKDILIYEVKYQENNTYIAGTYLWLVRHFLSLLPISLLPEYSNKRKFEWQQISHHCRYRIKYCNQNVKNSIFLNRMILKELTHLPREHVILLDFLIIFMRKISKVSTSNVHLQKRNLVIIANYFCSSIFIRPYRPGYIKKDMIPLLIYLLLKWNGILKGSEMGIITDKNTETNETIKSNETKYHIKEELLNTGKNIFKESWCQTEKVNFINKSSQTYNKIFAPFHNNVKNTYTQTDTISVTNVKCQTIADTVDHLINIYNPGNSMPLFPPLANSTAILSEVDKNDTLKNTNEKDMTHLTIQDMTTKYYSLNNSESFVYESKDETRYDEYHKNKTNFSFFSPLDIGNDWTHMIKKTSSTVKKIEEYFYDDYDTFTKEDFNQILDQSASGIREKILILEPKIENLENEVHNYNYNSKNNEENSYMKYDTVDDDAFGNTTEDIDEKIITDVSDSKLETKIYTWNTKNTLFKETRNKFNFGLKRFKLKVNFWRLLTHKNAPLKSIRDGYFNNPRYEKLKHVKANTL